MSRSLFNVYASAISSLERLFALVQLRHCAIGKRIRTTGRIVAVGGSNIHVGSYTTFVGGLIPTRLIAHSSSRLSISRGCVFNYGCHVEARERVDIGIGCKFGIGVVISDEHEGRIAPIAIANSVWLAHGVQVRPGVTIGEGAVVSAGSIVTHDVPPGMLATGTPVRLLPLDLVDAKPA